MITKIHNKYSNLSDFKKKHPGGEKILECCEGIDATAAFESYHVFVDMERIKRVMKQYECDEPIQKIKSSDYTFLENGFYYDVKERVKLYLKNKSNKWTFSWLFYFISTFSVYCYSFIYTFTYINQPIIYRYFASIISGTTLMLILFQGYHDASHSAISSYKGINENMALIGSGLAIWDWTTWTKHHCIMHHSFTGDTMLDPDTQWPLSKKSPIVSRNVIIKNELLMSIFLLGVPGLYLGQLVEYGITQYTKNIFGFNISKKKTRKEWAIIIIQILLMLYGRNIKLILLYFLTLNIHYCISILPDHDQFESMLNYDTHSKDWGEIQVRNSGNFAANNLLYTRLYGGINYQIEHHLFPSLCSYHLRDISKIVKETCRKHDIKYVSTDSIMDAYMSSIKTLYLINLNK